MSNLRYNRAFKKALIVIFCCMALFSSIVVFFVISHVQYAQLTSNMESVEATIIDLDLKVSRRSYEQEIYIQYEVDGTVYNRELGTDTVISFAAGRGALYSVGDKIQIFYDPQNPNTIATPRSQRVGSFYVIFALLSEALFLLTLIVMLKNRRNFLVTQEDYDKEGEELKKSKLAKKNRKIE